MKFLNIFLLAIICHLSYSQNRDDRYINDNFSFINELDYSLAIDSLSRLINENPDDIELYYYRGWCHMNNRKGALAFDDATKYLRSPQKKSTYNALILMGKIHLLRVTPGLALESFERAILHNDSRPEAYLEKANVYARRNNLDDGLQFVNSAIKKFPETDEFKLYRASLYLYVNNTKRALADFQSILDSKKIHDKRILIQSYFGIARINVRKKRYEEALEYAQKGVDLNPQMDLGYGFLGEIKYYLKDYDGSLADFKRFENRGQNSDYWVLIANIYEQQGDINSACIYYNKKCNMFAGDPKSCSKVRKLKCGS